MAEAPTAYEDQKEYDAESERKTTVAIARYCKREKLGSAGFKELIEMMGLQYVLDNREVYADADTE